MKPNESPQGPSPAPPSPTQRLVSLDALRGFDMFWIVGAESLVHALRKISDTGATRLMSSQLEHKDWEGFGFYDLIFPLFIFIVGVSSVFSLTKTIEKQGKIIAFRRILTRTLALLLLGIFYSGGIAGGWEGVRLLGVLQRIGLAYCFASLLFLTLNLRGMVAACVALLVGYWAMMTFIPVPGLGAGHFEKGANLANYIDEHFLPGRKYDGAWDPEGLLSTLPAIATCLLGMFAGMLIKRKDVPDQKKVFWLLGAGAAAVVVGFLWGLQFPVIKKIWTSSYVLVAGGYSAILLAVFYQIVDVWKFQMWAMPFVWIGMNPITIYLAHNIVNFDRLSSRLGGGPVKALFGVYGDLWIACLSLGLSFLIVWFLYRRKIFLRV